MAGGAVALALGAAVVHAVWNLLLARAEDTEAATAVALAASVALFALPAALTWRVEAEAWPYVAASTAFELGYVITLAGALGRGDLSVVYPLARGSAPVLVLAVSAGVLGAATSAWQVTGIALVAAGVLLVRGLRRPGDSAVIALALACGACIAGYTVVDAHGLEHAAALPYLWRSWRSRRSATCRSSLVRAGPRRCGARCGRRCSWRPCCSSAPTCSCWPPCGSPSPGRSPRCARRAW